MSHSTPAAMDELSAHPTMRVFNNETLCWDERLELYTWCKMPIFSVPVSKYEQSASWIGRPQSALEGGGPKSDIVRA